MTKAFAPEGHLPFPINPIVHRMRRAGKEIVLPARQKYIDQGYVDIAALDETLLAASATQADNDAGEFLVTSTREEVPGIEVFDEEMTKLPEGQQHLANIRDKPLASRIMFDSVDGTISLIESAQIEARQSPLFRDGFASMMSYVSENGEEKAAIVHRPLASQGATFVAIVGVGIWVDGEKQPPSSSKTSSVGDYKLAVDYLYSAKPELLDPDGLPFTHVQHYYHSNHAAPLSLEPQTVFLMYPNAKPWDMAPAAAFYRAHGGDVVAVGTGEPYKFGPTVEHAFVCVPNRSDAKEIAQRLAKHLAPQCVAQRLG